MSFTEIGAIDWAGMHSPARLYIILVHLKYQDGCVVGALRDRASLLGLSWCISVLGLGGSACLSTCSRVSLLQAVPPVLAGKWGSYPATLGMGLCTFDILVQIITHPLVDDGMVWTTRWNTGAPQGNSMATNYDALQARRRSTLPDPNPTRKVDDGMYWLVRLRMFPPQGPHKGW